MEVLPIKDPKKISALRKILRANKEVGLRDELLFLLGINTALRISDLLNLTLADVSDPDGKTKDEIELKEKKTGKLRQNPINKVAQEALKAYLDQRKKIDRLYFPEAPLFLSRKGQKAITRQQAHRLMAEAGAAVGLSNIGTHSLRKTFGYHVFKKSCGNLALVQKLLNHSSSGDTLRYIGIDREQMDNMFLELNLG
jgi:integrase